MKLTVPQVMLGKYAVKRAKKTANQDAPAKTYDPNVKQRSINDRGEVFPGEYALGSQKREKVELKKLKRVTQEAQHVLATAEAVFPFQLFPDKVTIDRHKLTIVYKQFFNIQQNISVPIENIKNIQVEVGPLLGAVIITSDHFANNTQEVTHLKKSDAFKIQRLVQGAMVAHAEGIDISRITSKELIDLLENLGKGDSSDKDYSDAI